MQAKKESFSDKLKRCIKERQRKVEKMNQENISVSSQIFVLIVHLFFVSFLFLHVLTVPYSNKTSLFMCFYSVCVLVFLAFEYKERINVGFLKASKMILVVTIVGFIIGFISYNSPIGEKYEIKQLTVFFENNKALVGNEYYNTYVKNKNDLEELRELRQRIKKDLDI